MDLFKLRIFVEIAETGNLTLASRNLNISQPAMSSQLKSLEEYLGYSLFYRNPRGMSLTAQGKTLIDDAREAIRSAENFSDRARSLGKRKEAISLGLNTDHTVIRINELLSEFNRGRTVPALFNLLQTRSEDFGEDILTRKIRGGFFYGAYHHPDVEVIPLREVPIHVVLPEAWSDHHDLPDDLARLAGYPWIWTSANCPFSQTVTAYFTHRGLIPDKVLHIDDEALIGSLVEKEVACSFLAEPIALLHRERRMIRTFPVAGLSVILNFGYRRDGSSHSVMEELAEKVRAIWDVPPGISE